MTKELKCPGGIFNGEIELHLVVVLDFKAEFTVFYEAVPAIFIKAEQPGFLKSVIVKPFAGWLISTERTACDDRHLMSAGYPFIDDGTGPRCLFVCQKHFRLMSPDHKLFVLNIIQTEGPIQFKVSDVLVGHIPAEHFHRQL